MEVTVIRLSRPLLINTAKNKDDYLQTVYGFLIPEKYQPISQRFIDDYVRYLCGMHCYSNGDNFFSISFDLRGVPDWVDKKGNITALKKGKATIIVKSGSKSVKCKVTVK